MPITWKNINTPSFASSNALVKSAGEQIKAGISGLGDVFTGRHGRQKEANTGAALAALGQLSNLDSYGSDAASILSRFNPADIDMEKVTDFQSERRGIITDAEAADYLRNTLRGRETEEYNAGVDQREFETRTREGDHNLKTRATKARLSASEAALRNSNYAYGQTAGYDKVSTDIHNNLMGQIESGAVKTEGDARKFIALMGAEHKLTPEQIGSLHTTTAQLFSPTQEEASAAATADREDTQKHEIRKERIKAGGKKGKGAYKNATAAPMIAPFFADDPTDNDKIALDKFTAALQSAGGKFKTADGEEIQVTPDQLNAGILSVLDANPTYGIFGDDTDFDVKALKKELKEIVLNAPIADDAAEMTEEAQKNAVLLAERLHNAAKPK